MIIRITVATAVVLSLLVTPAMAIAAVPSQRQTTSWDGELGPNALPGRLQYVALGDSFTAAEGAPYVDPNQRREYEAADVARRCALAPRDLRERCAKQLPDEKKLVNDLGWLGETGTDVQKLDQPERTAANQTDSYSFGGNNCHRSSHAYPARVWGALDAEDPGWGVTFAACSGAKTEHYGSGFRGEPAQHEAFWAGPANLVTLGFGGNDAGFGEVVLCMLAEAGVDRSLTISEFVRPLTAPFADKATEVDGCSLYLQRSLPSKLEELQRNYAAIVADIRRPEMNRLAPEGRIIAIGYPRLFPDNPPSSCGLGSAASIGHDNMVWLNRLADGLNTTLRAEARNQGFDFIDVGDVVNKPGPDGVHHDFCVDEEKNRWVNRFIPSDLRRSMHPKFQYHERVAQRVLDCWHNRASCAP